jgi:hypothetical protein
MFITCPSSATGHDIEMTLLDQFWSNWCSLPECDSVPPEAETTPISSGNWVWLSGSRCGTARYAAECIFWGPFSARQQALQAEASCLDCAIFYRGFSHNNAAGIIDVID